LPEGPDPGSGAWLQPFTVALPVQPLARQIVLLHQGSIIGTRTASAHPPTVEVLSPNGGETFNGGNVKFRWRAADANGDPITLTVQYSLDQGLNWRTLASDYSETNLMVHSTDLNGSTQAVWRVLASDGFYSVNDASDGPFVISDHLPTAAILSPA